MSVLTPDFRGFLYLLLALASAASCLALLYCWYVLIFKIGVCKPHEPVFAPDEKRSERLLIDPWYKQLNVGAMLITPVWLLANNLFGLFLFYVLLCAFVPWSCIAFPLAMLVAGTRISWAGGARWGNDVERFKDEQYFWSFMSVAWILCMIVLAILLGVKWW